MVELETESVDEDIIDVDKKIIEKGEFENKIKRMKEGNLRAYQFNQNTSLLQT